MSTFKVLLISANYGIALFGLVAFLSTAFHAEFMVPVIALACMPALTIVVGHLRKALKESRLWTALAMAGVLAPLLWLLDVLIALTYSDI